MNVKSEANSGRIPIIVRNCRKNDADQFDHFVALEVETSVDEDGEVDY